MRLALVAAAVFAVVSVVAYGLGGEYKPVAARFVAVPNLRPDLVVSLNVFADNGSSANYSMNADGAQTPLSSMTFTTSDGVTHYASGWVTYSLAQLGLPADATSVELGVKTLSSEQSTGQTYLALFAAPAGQGSSLCPGGDPAHVAFPIAQNDGNPVSCEVALTIGLLAGDGQRQFDSVTVPVDGGGLELAYDYERPAGSGDDLGAAVYVNGFTT